MYQLKDKGVGFTYLNVLDLEDAEQVSGREDLKNYALRLNYQPYQSYKLKLSLLYKIKSWPRKCWLLSAEL